MRRIHAVRVAMAALGVLAVVSAGEARQHKPPQSHAGDFDFYLLSMSIAPSFCALSPANRSKPDCRDLTADTFRETPLTIHGLWPNRAHVSVNQAAIAMHACCAAPVRRGQGGPRALHAGRARPGTTRMVQARHVFRPVA